MTETNRLEAAAPAGVAPARRFDWVRFAEAYALVAGIVVLGAVFGALRPEVFPVLGQHHHDPRLAGRFWSC